MLRAFAAPLQRRGPCQAAALALKGMRPSFSSLVDGAIPRQDMPFLHHRKRDSDTPRAKFKSPRKRASKLLGELEKESMKEHKEKFPAIWASDFRVGDAVQFKLIVQGGIHQKVRTYRQRKDMEKPGSTELYQETENVRGIIIGIVNRGLGSSVTLRDVIFGEVVEHQIPLYSPTIMGIKILERNFVYKGSRKVKRAKMYYLRDMNPLRSKVSTY